MSDKYQPPCTITPEIVSSVAEIAQTIGPLPARAQTAQALRLRRVNRIRTVQGSLAICNGTTRFIYSKVHAIKLFDESCRAQMEVDNEHD